MGNGASYTLMRSGVSGLGEKKPIAYKWGSLNLFSAQQDITGCAGCKLSHTKGSSFELP